MVRHCNVMEKYWSDEAGVLDWISALLIRVPNNSFWPLLGLSILICKFWFKYVVLAAEGGAFVSHQTVWRTSCFLGASLFAITFTSLIFCQVTLHGSELEVILGFWKVAVWSLCAQTFVQRYKWDVLASVDTSFGRERDSLSHSPCDPSKLPPILTSLCWSHPRRFYKLIWAWLESCWKGADTPACIFFTKENYWAESEAMRFLKSTLVFLLIFFNSSPHFSQRQQRNSALPPSSSWDRTGSAPASRQLLSSLPAYFPSSPPPWNTICFLPSN